jgi:hypothetical protein
MLACEPRDDRLQLVSGLQRPEAMWRCLFVFGEIDRETAGWFQMCFRPGGFPGVSFEIVESTRQKARTLRLPQSSQ